MMNVVPPTSYLPPIKQISSQNIETLKTSVQFLKTIYNPEVRGTKRRKPIGVTTDSKVIGEEARLKEFGRDLFERAYAIQWLTSLISYLSTDDTPNNNNNNTEESNTQREIILQNAASILALCAGTASAGTIIRDFRFRDVLGRVEIHVELIDIPLDNDDYGSVGAQTWGGSCVLSEMIVEDPSAFGLDISPTIPNTHNDDEKGEVFRVLELGAGTGLVSLVVAKLLKEIGGNRRVEIVATDYYPSVLDNLRANVERNKGGKGESDSSLVSVEVHPLDWSSFGGGGGGGGEGPFNEGFDLVLGADIIYESDHARWIQSCLVHLLKKQPTTTSNFHLVIPLRHTHQVESNTIETVFNGIEGLGVIGKEVIICDTEDSIEQVEYVYYKIGWKL